MSPLLAIQAELERAYAASDAYLALVRRVHAECGPVRRYLGVVPWHRCPSCKTSSVDPIPINHKPDCLWLAADACLKNGEGKP